MSIVHEYIEISLFVDSELKENVLPTEYIKNNNWIWVLESALLLLIILHIHVYKFYINKQMITGGKQILMLSFIVN